MVSVRLSARPVGNTMDVGSSDESDASSVMSESAPLSELSDSLAGEPLGLSSSHSACDVTGRNHQLLTDLYATRPMAARVRSSPSSPCENPFGSEEGEPREQTGRRTSHRPVTESSVLQNRKFQVDM